MYNLETVLKDNPDKFHEIFARSKTYAAILEHRSACKKWGVDWCLDCFGGGLNAVVKAWERALLREQNEKP